MTRVMSLLAQDCDEQGRTDLRVHPFHIQHPPASKIGIIIKQQIKYTIH